MPVLMYYFKTEKRKPLKTKTFIVQSDFSINLLRVIMVLV